MTAPTTTPTVDPNHRRETKVTSVRGASSADLRGPGVGTGAMINLYAGVLNLSGWDWTDTNGLIATAGYIIIGAFIGIRWFRWEAR